MDEPYYFPRWVWLTISFREPDKYSVFKPEYKGIKVYLT